MQKKIQFTVCKYSCQQLMSSGHCFSRTVNSLTYYKFSVQEWLSILPWTEQPSARIPLLPHALESGIKIQQEGWIGFLSEEEFTSKAISIFSNWWMQNRRQQGLKILRLREKEMPSSLGVWICKCHQLYGCAETGEKMPRKGFTACVI